MIIKVNINRCRNRNGASARLRNFVFFWDTDVLHQIVIAFSKCRSLIIQLFFMLGLYFFIGITGSAKFFAKKGTAFDN